VLRSATGTLLTAWELVGVSVYLKGVAMSLTGVDVEFVLLGAGLGLDD
jgi:hypothetical protein